MRSRAGIYRTSILLAVLCACGRSSSTTSRADEGEKSAPSAVRKQAAADGGAADAASAPDAATPAAALEGYDFIDEARLLYRVAACASDDALPENLSEKVVASHCRWLDQRKEMYRERYVDRAAKFIAEILPDDLPNDVVYPFGGGDLISALVAFPDAEEITTISLELAGDPRRIREIRRRDLGEALSGMTARFGGMLSVSNNTSENLSESQNTPLPTQLSMFLIGLAVNGYEPVSLRFFRIEPGGKLHYYTKAEIEEMDGKLARRRKSTWVAPEFSPAFTNSELRFRRRGEPGAPIHVHRHIAANLSNDHLARNPELMAHLEAKGRITALTKAASYLLWRPDFSTIRQYLLDNMELMLSDSTGIPPRFARKAGFEQVTYGRFSGSLLRASEKHNEDFRKLWLEQPRRKLTFRFGYVDNKSQKHLLVTKR